MDASKLYPPVSFPVSRGTPMISPVVKWNHEENHFVPYFDNFSRNSRRNFIINISDKKFSYLRGHVVKGQVLFPAAGWIYYVWETFAMMLGEPLEKVKVSIEDFKISRPTALIDDHDVFVTVSIQRGQLEVLESMKI